MTKKFSLTPYVFLTPALIAIFIFVVYPIIRGRLLQFYRLLHCYPASLVWVEELRMVDPRYDLLESVVAFDNILLVTPILIVLSVTLAIIVNRKLPGIHAFRTLFFIPVISGSIAVGIAWRLMLDTNGIINASLLAVGILKEPVQWLAEPALTLPICMALTVWLGLGYYMMIFLAGLQNIPQELYDAALIDGCNGWQKHWFVSVPGLRPQITFVTVISSLAALQVFNEIFTITGGLGGILQSGYTVVYYLWQQAFRLSHAGRASAIAIALLVITLSFSIINIRMLERSTEAD